MRPLFVWQCQAITCASHIQPLGKFIVTSSLVCICHITVESVDGTCQLIICRFSVLCVFSPNVLDWLAKGVALVEVDNLICSVFTNLVVDAFTHFLGFGENCRLTTIVIPQLCDGTTVHLMLVVCLFKYITDVIQCDCFFVCIYFSSTVAQ